MSDGQTGIVALRLISVSVGVLLLPGLAFLRAVRATSPSAATHLVLAFAISYTWVFALSVLLPLGHRSAAEAGWLTFGVVAVLFLMRRPTRNLHPGSVLRLRRDWVAWAAALVVLCALGWTIEPPITGEETVDLISAARFADGGPITLDNTSITPDTRAVYLFQPYALTLGLIARGSAVDPLVALVKLRSILVPLGFIGIYALLRNMTLQRVDALAALAVVAVFVAADFPTWEFNSLFPLVRRGGFSMGLCSPTLMVLAIVATRRMDIDPAAMRARRVAFCVLPGMLLAAMCTHALETFTFLCFVGGTALAILLRLDRDGSSRAALTMVAILSVSALGFTAVHARGVPQVSQYEEAQKAPLRADLFELKERPLRGLTGDVASDARTLWTHRIPSTVTGIIGIAAMGVMAWIAPAGAARIALGALPLAAAYLTRAGALVVALITSPATYGDVNAYFALLGLMSCAVALTAIARMLLWPVVHTQRGFARVAAAGAAGSIVLSLWWSGATRMIPAALAYATLQPAMTVSLSVALAVVLQLLGRWRQTPLLETARFAAPIVALAACLAIPISLAGRHLDEGVFRPEQRISLAETLAHAIVTPSVLNWPAYYPIVAATMGPPVPLPRPVVDGLRVELEPRQILLADPRYSCGLIALLDAYCVNPERIYGHYFLTARHYEDAFVRRHGDGTSMHPLFNDVWPLEESEQTFLQEQAFTYVLAEPQRAPLIERKLRASGKRVEAHVLADAYVLFHVL